MKTKYVAKIFGNRNRIATCLRMTRGAVYAWDEEVPELRAYQLQRIIDAVPRSRLTLLTANEVDKILKRKAA